MSYNRRQDDHRPHNMSGQHLPMEGHRMQMDGQQAAMNVPHLAMPGQQVPLHGQRLPMDSQQRAPPAEPQRVIAEYPPPSNDKQFKIQRFVYTSDGWITESTHEVEFSVDKPIFIKGVLVYNVCDYHDREIVHNIVVNDRFGNEIAKASRELNYSQEKKCEVFFPDSVLLQPFEKYRIIQMSMPSSVHLHWGEESLKEVSSADVTFKFSESEASSAASRSEGQIPGIIFSV